MKLATKHNNHLSAEIANKLHNKINPSSRKNLLQRLDIPAPITEEISQLSILKINRVQLKQID